MVLNVKNNVQKSSHLWLIQLLENKSVKNGDIEKGLVN